MLTALWLKDTESEDNLRINSFTWWLASQVFQIAAPEMNEGFINSKEKWQCRQESEI